jgi:hypothetical protein
VGREERLLKETARPNRLGKGESKNDLMSRDLNASCLQEVSRNDVPHRVRTGSASSVKINSNPGLVIRIVHESGRQLAPQKQARVEPFVVARSRGALSFASPTTSHVTNDGWR